MLRLKVSYKEDKQLEELIKILHMHVISFKISRNQKGKYEKAYIELDM